MLLTHQNPSRVTPRIDAHHHLWRYTTVDFDWISDKMSALKRDFLFSELQHELAHTRIDSAIAVQARSSLAETQWLLECARGSTSICGVVGWLPLQSDEASDVIGKFSEQARMVGVREIAQGQPSDFFEQPAFNRSIAHLTKANLTYDILIYANQLPEVTRFVDRHPHQRFVLDHAAKPPIARGELAPWRLQICELAKRENVVCKLSGLVTEASWSDWNLNDLRPYLDICVEAFGTRRLLAGSDWPVCLLATSYSQWWQTLENYFSSFSLAEIRDIFGGNALSAYPRAALSGCSLEARS